jgi:uncharacterized membrane protein HdeD (DUF308 family)
MRTLIKTEYLGRNRCVLAGRCYKWTRLVFDRGSSRGDIESHEKKEKVPMQRQRNTRSWIDGTNLIIGILLFIVPWVAGPPTNAVFWNAWIVGGLIAFNAGFALSALAAWEEWTNLVLGVWAAISPWLLGFQANVGATWTYVVLGCAVAVLAAVQLWVVDRRPPGVTA